MLVSKTGTLCLGIKLAIFLKKKGYIVHVCCKNTYIKPCTDEGIKCHDMKQKESLCLLYSFSMKYGLFKCIKVKPYIVHLISMRPAIVGLVASLAFNKKN